MCCLRMHARMCVFWAAEFREESLLFSTVTAPVPHGKEHCLAVRPGSAPSRRSCGWGFFPARGIPSETAAALCACVCVCVHAQAPCTGLPRFIPGPLPRSCPRCSPARHPPAAPAAVLQPLCSLCQRVAPRVQRCPRPLLNRTSPFAQVRAEFPAEAHVRLLGTGVPLQPTSPMLPPIFVVDASVRVVSPCSVQLRGRAQAGLCSPGRCTTARGSHHGAVLPCPHSAAVPR